MKTIREKIEEKIGNDYEKLFNNFIKKYPRSRRAFYALENTLRSGHNTKFYTGLKIEKSSDGSFYASQQRINVSGATVELV